MDPRINTIMEERGRFASGDHVTHLEVVNGADVGYNLAHVVHCTCGFTSEKIVYTNCAEQRAKRHVETGR